MFTACRFLRQLPHRFDCSRRNVRRPGWGAVVCLAVLAAGCNLEDVLVSSWSNLTLAPSAREISVDSTGYGFLRLEDLNGEDIYLARVKSDRVEYRKSLASTADVKRTAESDGENGARVPAGTVTIDGQTVMRYERHWQLDSLPKKAPKASRSAVSVYNTAKLGDTKWFYIDASRKQANATLKKIGKYSKIWVVGSVADGIITELSAKFDLIYPVETNLLGYEYGGGPGGNGGADGDPQIQILIYDIDGDGTSIGTGGVTLGYFYPLDEYRRDSDAPYSNEAEIFYLDSVKLAQSPDTIYSTLIHEFNHMINFNVKVLEGLELQSWNSETWYTEMLSMLAEDVIGPLVGISPDNSSSKHVTKERITGTWGNSRNWLDDYVNYGVMQWNRSDSLPYYSTNYAFGAYIVRNFGGVALFSHIAKSRVAGRASLDNALRIFNGQNVDSVYALSRFGEALVYSGEKRPEGAFSFDYTVEDTVGEQLYTFFKFDVWDMQPYRAGPAVLQYKNLASTPIPTNNVQLYSDESWKSVTGPLEIRLRDVDTSSKYYALIK
jgi:hypothetical protein